MFPFLSFLTFAQLPAVPSPSTVPASSLPAHPLSFPLPPLIPPPQVLPPQENLSSQERLIPIQEIIQAQEVRPLPGKLDDIPVFNSNSPELVLTEGILLSTFPLTGKRVPEAHLNFAFKGRFDIFAHHISKANTPSQTRTLFQGIILYNPDTKPVKVEILQAATYLTRPDALFIDLPAALENPLGNVYAGPGSRVTSDILRGRRQGNLPDSIVIPPGQSQMLMNLPIPAGTVIPTSNGRSTLIRLSSSGNVYVATLAMFAPETPDGNERVPTLEEWENLLTTGGLAGPRDRPPTSPTAKTDRVIYGRVSGVAKGSQWKAKLTDQPNSDTLTIPRRGRAFSYALSTLNQGTFGTGQIQSAPMLVRYPDTAYLANGNYGIEYNLTLPLHNPTKQSQTLAITLDTPIKQDKNKSELLFFNPPESRIFFRGTVRLRYRDNKGTTQTRYLHLVQRRGQQGEPLVTLNLPPSDRRTIEVDFLYPPDATPPQILTIKTLSNSN
jgi:Protein of unknown function (DUF3370)